MKVNFVLNIIRNFEAEIVKTKKGTPASSLVYEVVVATNLAIYCR